MFTKMSFLKKASEWAKQRKAARASALRGKVAELGAAAMEHKDEGFKVVGGALAGASVGGTVGAAMSKGRHRGVVAGVVTGVVVGAFIGVAWASHTLR